MVDFDLKSYIVLYLKNAQEGVKSIRSLISQKDVDVRTIHRLCHSLKGQSYFVGFNDIGNKALELEKYFKSLLDNNQTLGQGNNLNVNSELDEIEKLLLMKKI